MAQGIWTPGGGFDRQPQGPVGIDWANPITSATAFSLSGRYVVYSRKNQVFTPSNANLLLGAVGSDGVSLNYGGNYSLYSLSNPLQTTAIGDFTMVALVRSSSSVGSQERVVFSFGNSSQFVNLTFRYQDTPKRIGFYMRGSAGDKSIYDTTAIQASTRYVVACVYRASGQKELWVNGVLVASDAASWGSINPDRIRVGADARSGTNPFDANIFTANLIERALSDAEIASISTNPWQLFRDDTSDALIFDMGAGGGTSQISSDLAATFNVRAATTSDLGAAFNVRQAVAADLASTFNIRQAVAADLASTFNIRQAVTADLAPAFNVRGAAVSDAAFSYMVRTAVSADLNAAFAVRAAVQQSLDAAYNLRGAVSADAVVGYVVRGATSSDLSAAYSILSSNAVAASLDATYNVRGSVVSDLLPSYAVRSAVNQSLSATYAVRQAVASDLAASFVTRGAASSDLVASYEITTAQVVASTLTASYNVRSATVVALQAEYSVRQSVTTQLDATYSVRSAVFADLAAAYDVDAVTAVFADLTADYNLRAAVQSSLAAAYNVGNVTPPYTPDPERIFTVRRENRVLLVSSRNRILSSRF